MNRIINEIKKAEKEAAKDFLTDAIMEEYGALYQNNALFLKLDKFLLSNKNVIVDAKVENGDLVYLHVSINEDSINTIESVDLLMLEIEKEIEIAVLSSYYSKRKRERK